MPVTITDPTTGPKVELGRYRTTEEGQRVLVGRRIDGEVFVYDHPVGPGRPYFVERGYGSGSLSVRTDSAGVESWYGSWYLAPARSTGGSARNRNLGLAKVSPPRRPSARCSGASRPSRWSPGRG